jgi:hypothetical protein
VSSCEAGSEVFAGLFPDERLLRKTSPDARVGEPASIGSAELMPPRSIPVTATTDSCASPKRNERTSAPFVPACCPHSGRTYAPWHVAESAMQRRLARQKRTLLSDQHLNQGRHIGLSKIIALAHTGACQGHGGALLAWRFHRPSSLTELLGIDFLIVVSIRLFATSFNALSLASAGDRPVLCWLIGTVAANS